ncbi:MAG: AMP-binding protein [Thermodesulfobacteriota bacterium]|nr:AMP-binding protein [Thermodesulfobacteriota bacterium]
MIYPTEGQVSNLPLLNDCPAHIYSWVQYAPADKIKGIQTELFLSHLSYTLQRSLFYRESFKKNGIDLNDIRKLTDLTELPLTDKTDLENTESFCCADPQTIVDICLTSGTSKSQATIIPLTAPDLSRLAYNEEIALGMAGISSSDILLVCAALDRCFMAGMAYFLGGTRLSATVVRAGAGSAAQQWGLVCRTHATAIVGVPSLLYKIGKYALEQEEDPAASSIQKLIAIGEPTRDKFLSLLPISQELETMWDAPIFSTYASSEMATTFCECKARAGGHVRPELIIMEILDDNGRHLPDGKQGEVVVTPLGVTGMPLIRFKTGDISHILTAPCSCGRTTPRIAPVTGRKNQMLKYKGTTLFPNTILSALEGYNQFHGGYVEARQYPDGTDRVILYAALNGEVATPENISWIKDRLRATVRVVPEIKCISREEADKKVYQLRKNRKRINFFDLR